MWGTRKTDWYKQYDGWAIPRREFFVNSILKHEPESLLELGCAGGSNIKLLEGKWLEICGVEANANAIEYAKETKPWASYQEADITKSWDWRDRKYDVVAVMAVIMHCNPNAIDDIIYNMIKAANKAIVLIEDQVEKEVLAANPKASNYRNKYDFVKRFKEYNLDVTAVELAPELKDGEGKDMHLIEVKL